MIIHVVECSIAIVDAIHPVDVAFELQCLLFVNLMNAISYINFVIHILITRLAVKECQL